MNVRTVAIWALFGMACTSAGALSLPLPKAHAPSVGGGGGGGGGGIQKDDPASGDEDPGNAQVGAHFSAGDTLALDARLGHASVGERAGGHETFVFASVTGADAPAADAPPLDLAIVID